MGYMANVPLRFGDGFILPGERVPVERGRNYALMLRLGQVTVVPDRDTRERIHSQDESPEGGEDRLEDLTRKQLDEHAAALGVDEPEKLPNKDAVIAAIQAGGE